MSEFTERQTTIEEGPIKRARPIEETHYRSVVQDSRGMSGGAIAALVLAAVATAVLFTILIMNNQQSKSEEQLAQERAQMAAAQQSNQSQQPQQPPIVVLPQPQSGVTPPVTEQPAATPTAPTNSELELDVTTRILDDQDLRLYAIDVKVASGTAVLSGQVPTEGLKTRADSIARGVKGIRSVINNLVIKPEQGN